MDFDRRNNRPTNIDAGCRRRSIFVCTTAKVTVRISIPGSMGWRSVRRCADGRRIHGGANISPASNPAGPWSSGGRIGMNRCAGRSSNPAEIRQKRLAMRTGERCCSRYLDPMERVYQSRRMAEAWARDGGSRRQMQGEIARNLRLRGEISKETVRRALDDAGSIRGAAASLKCDRSVFRRFPGDDRAIQGYPGISQSQGCGRARRWRAITMSIV